MSLPPPLPPPLEYDHVQIGNMEQDTVFMLCCVLLTLACLCQHRLLILAAGNVSAAGVCVPCPTCPCARSEDPHFSIFFLKALTASLPPVTSAPLSSLPTCACKLACASLASFFCTVPWCVCHCLCCPMLCTPQLRVLPRALRASLFARGAPEREAAGLGLDSGEVDESLASKEDASA